MAAAKPSQYLIEGAAYVTSVHTMEQLPKDELPQLVFVGRSNVGKSSLLNFLTARKDLAHVSSTPGRTQGVNFFKALFRHKSENASKEAFFYLCDLPGVGYAKLDKSKKAELSSLLSAYLKNSQHIRAVFHLLDARREPNAEDKAMSKELRNGEWLYCVVLTKIDQIVLSKRKPGYIKIAQALDVPLDALLPVSVHARLGREDLLELCADAVL